MLIEEAAARDHAAMLALATQRCPFEDPAFLATVVQDPAYVEGKRMFVARDGTSLMGWGVTGHPRPMPSHWRAMRVMVAEEYAARGVGGALHQQLRDVVGSTGVELRSAAFDDDPRSLEIAHHWGFAVVQHSITSRLELDARLPAPSLPDDVTVEDCSALDLPDIPAVEAMLDASQTNPERAQFVMDLAFLRGFVTDQERPLGSLLRVAGRPAAISWGTIGDHKAHIIYTGVDAAHRGRGLGVLVKQHIHLLARDQGATVCRTDNEEHNTGIRHVNKTMGYEVEIGRYWLRNVLG